MIFHCALGEVSVILSRSSKVPAACGLLPLLGNRRCASLVSCISLRARDCRRLRSAVADLVEGSSLSVNSVLLMPPLHAAASSRLGSTIAVRQSRSHSRPLFARCLRNDSATIRQSVREAGVLTNWLDCGCSLPMHSQPLAQSGLCMSDSGRLTSRGRNAETIKIPSFASVIARFKYTSRDRVAPRFSSQGRVRARRIRSLRLALDSPLDAK